MSRTETISQENEVVHSAPRKVWEQRFVTTSQVREGHAAGWVREGVYRSLAEDSYEGRAILAGHMGGVYSFFFIDETGGEKYLEEVQTHHIAKEMELEEGYVADLASLLVDTGVIKSKQKIQERNSRSTR